jgi:Dyp-type peroxidase family
LPTNFDPPIAQVGISVTPPRQHLLLAALTLLDASVPDRRAAMEALRALVKAELEDQLAASDVETGELGFESGYDDRNLLVTVGLSTSGYDKLGAGGSERPIDLHPIPDDVRTPPGAQPNPTNLGEADVIVHIASDDLVVVEHVLRRIRHELSARLEVAWAQTGVQRFTSRQKGSRADQRALIGFLDGIANLHMDQPDDRGLVYVDHNRVDYPPNPVPGQQDPYSAAAQFPPLPDVPTGPEPALLDGGSYMAVEVLTINTDLWDQVPQTEQEHVVGRTKIDGQLAPNADGSSHARKANPHSTPEDELRRFLRRGYLALRSESSAMVRGLIFIGFGRSLTTQVEFVRRAWINNANFPAAGSSQPDLLLFGPWMNPTPAVCGYYFVPPLAKHNDPTSWVMPATDPATPAA